MWPGETGARLKESEWNEKPPNAVCDNKNSEAFHSVL